MTATRAGGGNGPDNAINPGTSGSVISPVIGDCGLHSCLLDPSVVPGSLPVRLVGWRKVVFIKIHPLGPVLNTQHDVQETGVSVRAA